MLLMLFAFTLIIFLIVHKKKQYHNLLEKQTMESNYQNQLLQSKLEVQEQSFKYFSEEIHDNIGQLLSIVKMKLYNIKNNSKEQEIVNQAASSNELLGKAINDLRNISHTLNSGFISTAGLADAVEKELEYIRSAKEVSCLLHVSGPDRTIGAEKELLTFRIIQEAVANALKHAGPTRIDIYLDYKQEFLEVAIADNGSGFDTHEVRKGGLGLLNMHVRADLLKSEIEISSMNLKGTTIKLRIPVTDEPAKELTDAA